MAKQAPKGTPVNVGNKGGSSGGKIGSAYGPNPSDKAAPNGGKGK